MKPVQLLGVVRAALEEVNARAEEKSIALEVNLDEGLGSVSGDASRLQQVVTNLLTNAVKFTPKGGKVTVTLAQDGPRLRLSVADTGIGIDHAFLPHVFDRFAQQDSSGVRAQGGLGLGLDIVRHLVEAHGGTVQATSPGRGRGATFTVVLPLLSPDRAAGAVIPALPALPATTDPPRPNGPVRLTSLRVLVVDDDALTRDALLDMLSQAGASVHAVGSVEEALRAMAEFRPGVLLSDLAMPDQDGLALIRRLREAERKCRRWRSPRWQEMTIGGSRWRRGSRPTWPSRWTSITSSSPCRSWPGPAGGLQAPPRSSNSADRRLTRVSRAAISAPGAGGPV